MATKRRRAHWVAVIGRILTFRSFGLLTSLTGLRSMRPRDTARPIAVESTPRMYFTVAGVEFASISSRRPSTDGGLQVVPDDLRVTLEGVRPQARLGRRKPHIQPFADTHRALLVGRGLPHRYQHLVASFLARLTVERFPFQALRSVDRDAGAPAPVLALANCPFAVGPLPHARRVARGAGRR